MGKIGLSDLNLEHRKLKPSALFGYLGSAWVFLVLILSLVAIKFLLANGYWALSLIFVLTLGIQTYKLTVIMHDCSHYSLFPKRKMNEWVGILGGAFLGSNFYTFTKEHWDHHKYCGMGADPIFQDYQNLENASKSEVALHIMKPLAGVAYFKILLSIFSPKKKEGEAVSSQEKSGLVSLLAILIVQSGIALYMSSGLKNWPYIFIYPLTALTLGLFFSRIRGFCEHIPMSNKAPEGECFIRSHTPNFFDRFFLLYKYELPC